MAVAFPNVLDVDKPAASVQIEESRKSSGGYAAVSIILMPIKVESHWEVEIEDLYLLYGSATAVHKNWIRIGSPWFAFFARWESRVSPVERSSQSRRRAPGDLCRTHASLSVPVPGELTR